MSETKFRKINNVVGWLLFSVALITYGLTVEPTSSYWDAGEYISTSAKLQVGHPPGAPFYQMMGAIFALFASDNESIAIAVNFLSVVSSAFVILFLFWSTTLFLQKIFSKNNCLKNFIEKNDSPPHTNDFIGWDKKENGYEHGYFYLTGGYYSPTRNPDEMQEFALNYLDKVLSKEERYIDWFDSMIGLFSYLESLGVTKIKSFQMNNNFSKSYLDESKTPPSYNEERKRINSDTYDCIVKEKIICNTWNDSILTDENPYVKMYADRINFDKYF